MPLWPVASLVSLFLLVMGMWGHWGESVSVQTMQVHMLSSLLSGVQILIDTCSSKGQNVHVCLFVCFCHCFSY